MVVGCACRHVAPTGYLRTFALVVADIQRVFRGYIGRIISKFRRLERDNRYGTRFWHYLRHRAPQRLSACVCVCGCVCVCVCTRLAVILQCGYRQWMARRQVWRLLIRRQRRGEVRTRAAILIQTVYRGYKLRKLLKWWRWGAYVIQVPLLLPRWGGQQLRAVHVYCPACVMCATVLSVRGGVLVCAVCAACLVGGVGIAVNALWRFVVCSTRGRSGNTGATGTRCRSSACGEVTSRGYVTWGEHVASAVACDLK